ncbi:MAG: radical SAM family heme chaperone HemW [Blautia sp.]|nr:radical SAM family heme chaperone HemW [Lachnoclostridium sp.]MCM1210412.1 radical SAM family heme chaperone HemW [Blautia sp.]
MRELSVYIHIPFCIRKCRYCDFLSGTSSEEERREYLALLLKEIKNQSLLYKEYQVISVFIGGGTPSILEADAIETIIHELKQDLTFVEEPEITIEVNPGTVTEDKLIVYRQTGINRLSIGLQTANDEELKILGRIHDYEDFCHTYEAARRAGFQNINVDLMSAIPKQTLSSYRDTLQKVLAYGPQHISAYSLILEEGTWFYEHQKELTFPGEEEDRQLYGLTGEILSQNGYNRYEISNYAREGYECLHNKVYWQRGNYVGFGLGAASMVQEVRFSNPRDIDTYREMLGNPAIREENKCYLTREEQMEEFMFLGLRLMKGVRKEDFLQKFGVPMNSIYGEILKKLQRQGLLLVDDSVRLTTYGIDISNYVMAQFLLT